MKGQVGNVVSHKTVIFWVKGKIDCGFYNLCLPHRQRKPKAVILERACHTKGTEWRLGWIGESGVNMRLNARIPSCNQFINPLAGTDCDSPAGLGSKKFRPPWRRPRFDLGWEDPLEKGMAIHSSILPGEFHGQKSLAGHSPWAWKESGTTEQLSFSFRTDRNKQTWLMLL